MWRVTWVVENSNVPARQKLLYNCSVMRSRVIVNKISKTAFLEGMKKLKDRANKCIDQGKMYFEE
jgi:hypothetical protein